MCKIPIYSAKEQTSRRHAGAIAVVAAFLSLGLAAVGSAAPAAAQETKTSTGTWQKTIQGFGGAIAAPMTAYVYDWNMLPIGQALWLKELQSYIDFPMLQNPASYNLDQVMQQVRDMKSSGLSD
jgi:hypothetical protein